MYCFNRLLFFRRSSYLDTSSLVRRAVAPLYIVSCLVAPTGVGWRNCTFCLVLPVIFSRLFICMVDITIFGFNLSFVQLQVVPCFSSGPTGNVWGPTSRSELPCYDSQPTVLYCCHCHCQGTGARYALTTAPGSFRCLGVNIQYTRPPD